MTISALQIAIFENAKRKGFYDAAPCFSRLADHLDSEIKEARHAAEFSDCEAFFEELSDIVILTLSIAAYYGRSLEQDILRKHEKNKLRPVLHGKAGY